MGRLGVLGILRWGLGGVLRVLGPILAPRARKVRSISVRRPPSWGPRWVKLGAKSHPKSIRRLSKKRQFLRLVLGSGFGVIWCQLYPNLKSETFPKSIHVGSKIDSNCPKMLINSCSMFDHSRDVFSVNFASKVGRPRGPKPLKKCCFSWYFCYLGQLAKKRQYDRFLVNLSFNLKPKTFQSSTQEVAKIR